MQIHSDVSGIPIQIPEVQDAPLLGSAILAAVASGLYPTIRDGAQKMVRIQDRILPDRKNHDTYRFFVDRYIETYDRLSESMHKMTAERITI
jgi:ribulose kinase